MWISGLHVPESYMTALVQKASRARSWALDKSTLYTKVTRYTDEEQVSAPLTYGSYMSGLYLEGAAWDHERGVLRRQDPKILVMELPIIEVIPIETTKLRLAGTFRTPVYVTQIRNIAKGTGTAFEADLATDDHSSLWVLQGVACVLNVDT